MTLKDTLTWTKSPLIINAPMGGIAGADLAIAVTKAGGVGQIGGVPDYEDLSRELEKAESALDRHDGLLPNGVGILSFAMNRDDVLPVLERFQPAILWIFAAHRSSDYADWTRAIRNDLPRSQVWIQVGSVEGALTIAEQASPDVLCLQGVDAGGHGLERGAGVVSLVPEVIDALRDAGRDRISVVAAGGIGDGRAVAAALMLGAEGAVMGTRFLSATETRVHDEYRKSVIAASDGGQTTVRAKVFDRLRGPNRWPVTYDGRSLRTASFQDHAAGVDIDEIRRRHADAVAQSTAGYAADGVSARAATWAGTAVGLVRREQSAAEIVEEVRTHAVACIAGVQARL